ISLECWRMLCDRPGGLQSWKRIALGEVALMPVRIDWRDSARGVEPGYLISRQVPANRAKILAQLSFIARAKNDRRKGRAVEQPVERNLRKGLASLRRDLVHQLDGPIQRLAVAQLACLGCYPY